MTLFFVLCLRFPSTNYFIRMWMNTCSNEMISCVSCSCQAKNEQTEINQKFMHIFIACRALHWRWTFRGNKDRAIVQRTNKLMHIYLDVIIVWQMPIKLNRAAAIRFVIPEAHFSSSSSQHSTFVYIPFLPMFASSHAQTIWLRWMRRKIRLRIQWIRIPDKINNWTKKRKMTHKIGPKVHRG